MSLKRIYTFDEEEGLNVMRLTPSAAAPEEAILAPANLSNWQLAVLYVVGLEESATLSEIGFALVMDRPTVAAILRPLRLRDVVRNTASTGLRKEAVTLTDSGHELLATGLDLWRTEYRRRHAAEDASSIKFAQIG